MLTSDRRKNEENGSQLEQLTIVLNLPTVELAKQWRKLAFSHGMNISQFIIAQVLKSCKLANQEGVDQSNIWNDLIDQLRDKERAILQIKASRDYFKQRSIRLEQELFDHYSEEL